VDVEALKVAALSERVTSNVTSAWWQRISPLLWLAVGGVIVLFLIHADELLRHFVKP
jgi:type II secretory pathway component PulF